MIVHSSYFTGTSDSLSWVSCRDGHVPENAVCGGWDANYDEKYYVGKLAVSGSALTLPM